MVGEGSGRIAARWASAFVLLVVAGAGCSCDDQLITIPEEERFGGPGRDVHGVSPWIETTGGVTCGGSEVPLSAKVSGGAPPYEYRWEPAEGLSDPTAPDPIATGRTTTTYTVTVTDSRDRSATAEVTVERLPAPEARIAFRAGEPVMCRGGDVVLDGAESEAADGGPVTHAWSLDRGVSGTGVTFAHRTTEDVTVRLTVTDGNGCTDVAEQFLDYREDPEIDLAFLSGSELICDGEPVIIDASGSRDADGNPVSSFGWDVDGQSGFESTSSRVGPYTATGVPAVITVRDSYGCTASLTQEVRVGQRPDPVATFTRGALSICEGETVVIDCLASTSADGGPPAGCNWDLEGNPGIDHHGTTTPPFVPEEGKAIRMSVQDPSGCSANLYLTFDIHEPPAVDAGPDQRIARGELASLGTAAAQPGFTYAWTCDNWSCGLSDATAPEPWALPEGNTAYTLTLTDGVCTVSDTALVTMGPRVVASMPLGGETWPSDARLWLLFDGDMDRNSFAGNVRLLDAQTGGEVSISSRWDGATRHLIVSPGGLVQGRAYLLEVDGGAGGVRSADGDVLHADYALRFTAGGAGDGQPPGVVYKQPAIGAAGVSPTTDVVVTFDEPLDPTSVGTGTFFIAGVPAEVSYDPRSWTATLEPLVPLAPGASHRVDVRGIRDASGAAADFSWQFQTGNILDTIAPRVISAQPAGGAGSVDLFSAATVTFDEPVDPTSLAGIRLIEESTGMPVAAEVFWDAGSLVASLEPREVLAPATRYRLETSGIRDQAGNVMGGLFSRTFTTQAALLIEDFEDAPAGWSLTGAWSTDADATYAGSAGLSDSPDACGCTSSFATTAPIPLSSRNSVTVSFWSRESLSTDGRDAARLEYSVDGSSWSAAGAYAGPSGWNLRSHVIDTGRRSTQLWLRFRLDVDAATNLDGWFIDQLVVR